MKFISLFSFLFSVITLQSLAQAAQISEVPDLPPSVCYGGCTERMNHFYDRFLNQSQAPSLVPAVYSGECVYQSSNMNPDDIQYAVLMFDQNDQNENIPYMSVIYSFYEGFNYFADWNLEIARQEMSSDWKHYGKDIRTSSDTARVIVPYESGDPAYVYWMRQDAVTHAIYLITYAGASQVSFCELNPQ